ncbi:MAG: DNA mismatch repair endonuclease MutL, partial [Candidatus Latescibacteria bacterium]|nr:DNA mismatch repair endonuclease MutL [Candidatus Latescibacterota bacterium]
KVTDNGCGMGRDDAILAFDRHATSKIRDSEDLEKIGTFGFRGEALPSIASVAKVELTTNTPDGVAGTRIRIDGGTILSVDDVGRASGTTISVSHLFYNVPARRKFLRGADTEQRHIGNAVTTTALAYPEIAFTFISDGREVVSLSSVTNTHARAKAVIGDTLMNQMVPVTFEDGTVQITGFISRPDSARIARTNQNIFVNLRPVTSRMLNHAVYEGYGSLLPRERYPFTILYMSIDLDQVDVNVHPTKREIRFSNDSLIYERTLRAIRLALQQSDVVPEFTQNSTSGSTITAADIPVGSQGAFAAPAGTPGDSRPKGQIDLFNAMKRAPRSPDPWTGDSGSRADVDVNSSDPNKSSEGEDDEESAGADQNSTNDLISLWQLHRTYIFAQIKGGLVIIDQHAAHERVLFEQALSDLKNASGVSQQLLFPITLDLAMSQYNLVVEHAELFDRIGFSVKMFGGQTVVIDAVPSLARQENGDALFQQVLDELTNMQTSSLDPIERMAAAFSSRAGITKGVALSQQEMNALINDLFATEMPYASPHGRPVVVRVPVEELDRKFKR